MNLIDAAQLARTLMDAHGLADWMFAFDRAVQRFGCCHQCQRITLSRILTELNDVQEVKDTILHEIAHALEPGQGHNQKWKCRAVMIGCLPKRCYSTRYVKTPRPKYVGTCPNCGTSTYRNRRTNCSCGRCSPLVYNPKYHLEWKKLP